MLTLLKKEQFRTNRNLLIAGVLAFSLSLLVIHSNIGYLKVVFQGSLPTTLTTSSLTSSQTKDALNNGEYFYVNIQGDKLLETIIEETVQSGRRVKRTNTYYNYLLALGDKVILVKSSEDYTYETSFTGVLKMNDPKVVGYINDQDTEGGDLLPYYLDTQPHSANGAYIMILALVASFGVLFLAIMRFVKPDGHHLSKYTKSLQLEHQVPIDSSKVLKFQNVVLTPSTFIIKHLFSIKAVAMSEITWAYMEVTNKRMYFIIPAGKTTQLTIHTQEEKFTIPCSTKNVEAALIYLHELLPNVKIGYESPTREETTAE